MAAGNVIIMADDIPGAPVCHRRFLSLRIKPEFRTERGQRLRPVAMILRIIIFGKKNLLDLCRQIRIALFILFPAEYTSRLRHDAEPVIIISRRGFKILLRRIVAIGRAPVR